MKNEIIMKHTLLLTLLFTGVSLARTNYVSLHGAHVPPFTSWAAAATNIQDAVDAAQDGDVVLVSNGLYNSGSRVTPNAHLHNRVVITNAITVQSLNGPDVTVIAGAADPATGSSGSNAVRGVYMSGGAHLRGFTVSNGFPYVMLPVQNMVGAGVFMEDNTVISQCVVSYNFVPGGFGAGIYGLGNTRISDTVVSHNVATSGSGIQAETCMCWNVLVEKNDKGSAWLDNGINIVKGFIESSSICKNTGGGVYVTDDVTLNNSIVWGNTIQLYAYGSRVTNAITYYSCIQDYSRLDHGTISNDPQFVDAGAGDFRLLDTSPCINAGTNMPWMWTATDLDGNPRIQHGVVDMGCYESAVPEPGMLALAGLAVIWGRRRRQEA